MLTREEVEQSIDYIEAHPHLKIRGSLAGIATRYEALQTALAVMAERDALAAEGRLLREALEHCHTDYGTCCQDCPLCYESAGKEHCCIEQGENIAPLITAEAARVRRLEAERDDARKWNVASRRHLDLVDALSRNTDRIDRLILAAVLRTVGGRVEIPQEHLDAAGHTDFIVSAPTPDKLVVMIEQPEGPEGGDYGHL